MRIRHHLGDGNSSSWNRMAGLPAANETLSPSRGRKHPTVPLLPLDKISTFHTTSNFQPSEGSREESFSLAACIEHPLSSCSSPLDDTILSLSSVSSMARRSVSHLGASESADLSDTLILGTWRPPAISSNASHLSRHTCTYYYPSGRLYTSSPAALTTRDTVSTFHTEAFPLMRSRLNFNREDPLGGHTWRDNNLQRVLSYVTRRQSMPTDSSSLASVSFNVTGVFSPAFSENGQNADLVCESGASPTWLVAIDTQENLLTSQRSPKKMESRLSTPETECPKRKRTSSDSELEFADDLTSYYSLSSEYILPSHTHRGFFSCRDRTSVCLPSPSVLYTYRSHVSVTPRSRTCSHSSFTVPSAVEAHPLNLTFPSSSLKLESFNAKPSLYTTSHDTSQNGNSDCIPERLLANFDAPLGLKPLKGAPSFEGDLLELPPSIAQDEASPLLVNERSVMNVEELGDMQRQSSSQLAMEKVQTKLRRLRNMERDDLGQMVRSEFVQACFIRDCELYTSSERKLIARSTSTEKPLFLIAARKHGRPRLRELHRTLRRRSTKWKEQRVCELQQNKLCALEASTTAGQWTQGIAMESVPPNLGRRVGNRFRRMRDKRRRRRKQRPTTRTLKTILAKRRNVRRTIIQERWSNIKPLYKKLLRSKRPALLPEHSHLSNSSASFSVITPDPQRTPSLFEARRQVRQQEEIEAVLDSKKRRMPAPRLLRVGELVEVQPDNHNAGDFTFASGEWDELCLQLESEYAEIERPPSMVSYKSDSASELKVSLTDTETVVVRKETFVNTSFGCVKIRDLFKLIKGKSRKTLSKL